MQLTLQPASPADEAKMLAWLGLEEESLADRQTFDFVRDMFEELGYTAAQIDYRDYVDHNFHKLSIRRLLARIKARGAEL